MKKIKFWPIFLSTTFVILINVINLFVDEVVLSRHYNDTAFAAKNLSEPILWCVPFLSGILCTGAVRAYLNAKAAKDRKRADISFSQGLWTSVMLGFILATVMLVGRKTLVDLVAGGIQEYLITLEYLTGRSVSVLLCPVFLFLFAFAFATGGTVICVIASIASLAANIILSSVLVKSMGVRGTSFATGISMLPAILILCLHFPRLKRIPKFTIVFDGSVFAETFMFGLRDYSSFLSVIILQLVVNSLAVKKYENFGIVVVSVVINMIEALIFLSHGIGNYEGRLIDYAFPRQKRNTARNGVMDSIKAAVVESVILTILILIFASWFVRIFNIDYANKADQAAFVLRILSLSPIMICMIRIPAVFYGHTERAARSLICMIAGLGVLPGILAFVFGQISLAGMAIGMEIGFILFIMLFYFVLLAIKKEKPFVWRV